MIGDQPYNSEDFVLRCVKDPLDYDYIIFAGNLNNAHWFSVVIDNIEKQVSSTSTCIFRFPYRSAALEHVIMIRTF